MPEIHLTDNAIDRLKQRVGVKRRSAREMAQRAYDSGVTHKGAKGRLKRWFDHLWREHRSANNLRVYGKHVYLFSGSTLITVLHLPKQMEGALSKSTHA